LRPFSLVHFPFSPGLVFCAIFYIVTATSADLTPINCYLADEHKQGFVKTDLLESSNKSVYEFMDLNYIYIIQAGKKNLIVEPCLYV